MLCVVFAFVSLYFGCNVTPSENIHPKRAGGQVPGNRAPVPGCVLRVELRRVSRFRIGCSIMDGLYVYVFFLAVCVDVLHVILCKFVFLYGVRCGL